MSPPTVLEGEEVLTRVTLSKPKDASTSAYIKLGLRNASAMSVVSIALLLGMEGGRFLKARVAPDFVAFTPMRVRCGEGPKTENDRCGD